MIKLCLLDLLQDQFNIIKNKIESKNRMYRNWIDILDINYFIYK